MHCYKCGKDVNEYGDHDCVMTFVDNDYVGSDLNGDLIKMSIS